MWKCILKKPLVGSKFSIRWVLFFWRHEVLFSIIVDEGKVYDILDFEENFNEICMFPVINFALIVFVSNVIFSCV
jgi:hypothetical protein